MKLERAIGLSLLLLAFFGVFKHLAPIIPFGTDIGFLIILCYQIWVPLWVADKEGITAKALNISAHGLFEPGARIDRKGLLDDLKRVFWLCVATLPPFLLVFHLVHLVLANHYGFEPVFNWRIPNQIWFSFITNIFLVAMPEEIFYRGYLQSALLKAWPNKAFFLGVPVGRAVIVTSFIFALCHFIGEYDPMRLLPFFPAFLFSFLVFKSRSIFGATLFHAICNVYSEILQNSYSWSP